MGRTYWGRRPMHLPSQMVPAETISSTSDGVTISPYGHTVIATTSTGAPVVFTLAAGEPGMRKVLGVDSLASSSDAPIHINAASSNVTFDGTNDMVTLSTNGSSIVVVARSSGRWDIESDRGATLAAST